MTTVWTQEALKELKVRDEVEKKESEYFTAFKQLSAVKNSSNFGGEADVDSEVRQLVADKETLIGKMNALHFTIEKLNDKLGVAGKTNRALEKELAAATAKVKGLELEVREKNKAIETVNDELLSLNIQNNVLSEKVKELTAENEALIKRWMDKVKADAEKLNEANERVM